MSDSPSRLKREFRTERPDIRLQPTPFATSAIHPLDSRAGGQPGGAQPPPVRPRPNPIESENEALRRKLAKAEAELAKAQEVIEVQ